MAYTNLFAPYQQPWTQPFSAQPQLPQVPQVPQVQPFAAQQPAPQAQQPNAMTGNFVIEVFGRQGAEALPLGPNSKLVAFDKVLNVGYRIQTDDAANKDVMEFDFTPRERSAATSPDYVTREDFDALAAKVDALAASPAPKPAPRARKAAVDE